MDEIDKIQEALKTTDNPIELAGYLTKLAGWNSYYTEMMKKIQLVKPKVWLDIQHNSVVMDNGAKFAREKPLSDKKTEMTWAATEDGQKETALTFELKRIAILYQSISRRLYAIEQDFKQSKSQI